MTSGTRGAVSTLGDGSRVVHGTNLSGAAGRGGLGWIVDTIGMMACQKFLLVSTEPTVCCWEMF